MTLTSVSVVEGATNGFGVRNDAEASSEGKVWPASQPPFKGYTEPQTDGFSHSSHDTPIVIDNGSSLLRAGWSFEKNSRVSIPANVSKYRERRSGKNVMYAGWDTYADLTTRSSIRSVYEPGSNIILNWDVLESVLDYTFLKMGVQGNNGTIDRPIVMTEPVANLPYSRRTMNELLFECFGATSVAFGIDALFSYHYNQGNTGLVISSSHTATHLIPVLDKVPIFSSASRLNWGGWHHADYLAKSMKLKYPSFPAKTYDFQFQDMTRKHCYTSLDYEKELSGYLDRAGLDNRDRTIQYPFSEQAVVEKSEEELARIAERKREGGRRLQAQAAKMRLEKLIRKEEELVYWKDLQSRLQDQTKKEIKRLLDADEIKDEEALARLIRDLEANIKKQRNKDVGIEEPTETQEPPSYPLLEIPDEQLDEAGLKAKRHQRLMKAGFDARARAREEKEREQARIAEEQRADEERRTEHFDEWIAEKRKIYHNQLQKLKDQKRAKADSGNRKGLASQIRMKTLANLASDQPGRRKRKGGDDDDFGANDDDWGVYRTVQNEQNAGSDEEEEEDPMIGLQNIEATLLQYDPDFDESKTLEAQNDWRLSLLHAFYHGARPFDPESVRDANQIHLNVERIRVPEVLFQPSIAGVDQAGIIEIASSILSQQFPDLKHKDDLLKDVFLTGGNTLFQNFDERMRRDLRSVLDADAPLNIRKAADPIGDAWRGAAMWARSGDWKASSVTKAEYEERGADYIKEHNLGNGPLF